MKCVRCDQELPEGIGSFCPFCGQVNLSDSIIYNSTTANHDPLNRDYKPWRDKPLVPVRNYIIRNSTKKAWLPTIKPPSKAMKKIIIEEKSLSESASKALSDAESLRSGFSKSLANSLVTDDTSSIASLTSKNYVSEKNVREHMFPLGIFELEISDMEIHSIELLFSLVEQSFITDREKCRVHWLKISVNNKHRNAEKRSKCQKESDDKDHTDALSDIEEENKEEEENWQDLCFLSNVGGRLIATEYNKDWIDLPSIDPEEFYMSKHVQQILQPMCYRYKQSISSLRPSILYDVIGKKQLAMSRYHGVLSNFTPNNANEIIVPNTLITYLSNHTTTSLREENENSENDHINDHSIAESKESIPSSPELQRFYFDDTFIQWEEDIRVKQPNTVVFCKLLVKIKALYHNRFLFSSSNSSQRSDFSYDTFRQGIHPTHLEITLQSTIVYKDFHFPVVMIRFENDILQHLLKSTMSIHDVFEESEDHPTAYLMEYFQKVLNLIRLCYTSNGIGYEIVGSFPDPPVRFEPWPSEIAHALNIFDEDLSSSDEH